MDRVISAARRVARPPVYAIVLAPVQRTAPRCTPMAPLLGSSARLCHLQCSTHLRHRVLQAQRTARSEPRSTPRPPVAHAKAARWQQRTPMPMGDLYFIVQRSSPRAKGRGLRAKEWTSFHGACEPSRSPAFPLAPQGDFVRATTRDCLRALKRPAKLARRLRRGLFTLHADATRGVFCLFVCGPPLVRSPSPSLTRLPNCLFGAPLLTHLLNPFLTRSRNHTCGWLVGWGRSSEAP